jgi:osmoprotectant transport system substrate-binding protein
MGMRFWGRLGSHISKTRCGAPGVKSGWSLGSRISKTRCGAPGVKSGWGLGSHISKTRCGAPGVKSGWSLGSRISEARCGAPGVSVRRCGARGWWGVLAVAVLLAGTGCSPPRPDHPVIGAKNFTEQVILGELLAQEIEAHSHLKVERRFYLAGSYICHQALVSGRFDAYVEYTGTALTAILKQPLDRDPEAVLSTVRRLYASRYHVRVGEPLGFENTFAMVIRGDDAERLHLQTLSEAARYTPQWKLGVGYEFEQRPDGLPGLSRAYGLKFDGPPRTMDLGLLYRALSAHQVDMIAANSTDGPIEALHLKALADDRHYFPPYQAVPLVREEALARWPEIGSALHALAGRITAEDMRTMNEAVDGQHRDAAEVVREFRANKGL